MNKIIVVGSSNTDMIVKVPRIPVPGETVLGGEFFKTAGGKGANQAVAAARSGGSVALIANTGNDNLGRETVENLKREGINTEYVFVDDTTPSGVALIFVGDDGENSIGVASGANKTLSPAKISKAQKVISGADILLTQLEIPLETVEEAIRIARKSGVKVILNPAPAQRLSDNFLKQIDILTPNQTEVHFMTGVKVNSKSSAEKAAALLLTKGVKTVIITLGAKGAFIMNKDLKSVIPGFKVETRDTTAAGDTFNGMLAVGLAQQKPIEEAVRLAQAAAAISVTKMGAQTSIPNQKEILDFLSDTS